jgi:hypothetical protein
MIDGFFPGVNAYACSYSINVVVPSGVIYNSPLTGKGKFSDR